ncbi:selenium-dependent molybdenum cofactor biosynthesis protein YqeB [Anaerosphaera multitolerans]|uniref:EF2563 family selenium-dependent molybdenum hydroxylase system protein n=1 Tax=Anaerosphaera multitolerans TaxID=2487351 RepID=A0A437S538_9FIRM|nr:selenium-dependent molybdenum cofactor biosynthesis protein YqeB [Anaerosphaera multitolerans]RVU54135.1 EF2563 family selenium-dependent molybdenum hydroxylase system protein [Anaerosphaera multitolerans]
MKKIVVVRGGGDIATGVIQKLHRSGFKVLVLEVERPTSIRRKVAVSEAIYENKIKIEDFWAEKAENPEDIYRIWKEEKIPVYIDSKMEILKYLKADVLVDGIIAKKNLGMKRDLAEATIALGPGFEAGIDVDIVVETNRGHDLGRLIFKGSASENTGNPGNIMGYTVERVLYSPENGKIKNCKDIGDIVSRGDVISEVNGEKVLSKINGIVRGLIRNGTEVFKGMKIGDVDPRVDVDYMTISDKARNIGGAVLEAVMIMTKDKN